MSEIKLQDYIHYYIGCRSVNSWFPEGHDMYNANWLLEAYCSKDIKPYKLDNENTFTWTDSIKLILRKIEDMTDEEVISLASLLVHPDEFKEPSTHKNEFGDVIVMWGDPDPWDGGYETFNATGEKCFSNDQLHFLIQHGFDIFGLIDNGLAIDSKTLK